MSKNIATNSAVSRNMLVGKTRMRAQTHFILRISLLSSENTRLISSIREYPMAATVCFWTPGFLMPDYNRWAMANIWKSMKFRKFYIFRINCFMELIVTDQFWGPILIVSFVINPWWWKLRITIGCNNKLMRQLNHEIAKNPQNM